MAPSGLTSKQWAVQPFFFIEAYTYKSNTHIRTQLTSSKRLLFAKLKLFTRVVTSLGSHTLLE